MAQQLRCMGVTMSTNDPRDCPRQISVHGLREPVCPVCGEHTRGKYLRPEWIDARSKRKRSFSKIGMRKYGYIPDVEALRWGATLK